MGTVGNPHKAQTTPCKVVRVEGGNRVMGWSPGVRGGLSPDQMVPPRTGEDGKPLPYCGPPSFTRPGPPGQPDVQCPPGSDEYNPGVCPWYNYEAAPEELVKFYDCENVAATDCFAGVRNIADPKEREAAFDQCLTPAVKACDTVLTTARVPRQKPPGTVAPKPKETPTAPTVPTPPPTGAPTPTPEPEKPKRARKTKESAPKELPGTQPTKPVSAVVQRARERRAAALAAAQTPPTTPSEMPGLPTGEEGAE
jgi:hypothetical protein